MYTMATTYPYFGLVREDTELVITVHYVLEDPDYGVHFVPSNTPFFPEVE